MDVDSKSKWVDKKNDDSCRQQSEKCEILLNFLQLHFKYHKQYSYMSIPVYTVRRIVYCIYKYTRTWHGGIHSVN